eukprot:1962584-Ditylum_brightwellii.AAC.1
MRNACNAIFSKLPDTSRGVKGSGSTDNPTAKIAHVIPSYEPSNPPTQPSESIEQTPQKDREPTTSQVTTTPHVIPMGDATQSQVEPNEGEPKSIEAHLSHPPPPI